MDGNIIGLVAVTMALGIPIAALYTFYRVRKLRTDERIAAMARGVAVPMEPELSQVARSRRYGILLTAGAVGYMITFALIWPVRARRTDRHVSSASFRWPWASASSSTRSWCGAT